MHRVLLTGCSVFVALPLLEATTGSGAESRNTLPWRQDEPPNPPYTPQEAPCNLIEAKRASEPSND